MTVWRAFFRASEAVTPERRPEAGASQPSLRQKRRSSSVRILLHWWTCGELNSGLTRFKCGSYTFSLWSVSRGRSPQTSSFPHTSPKCLAPRGRSAEGQRSLLDYALSPTVGLRGRTGLNSLSRKRYAASLTEPSLRRASDTIRLQSNPKQAHSIDVLIIVCFFR